MPVLAASRTALPTPVLVIWRAIASTPVEIPASISWISVWVLLLAYWTSTFIPVAASTDLTALSAGVQADKGAV